MAMTRATGGVLAVAILLVLGFMVFSGRSSQPEEGGPGTDARCSVREFTDIFDKIVEDPAQCINDLLTSIQGGEGAYQTAYWSYAEGGFQTVGDPVYLAADDWAITPYTDSGQATYTWQVFDDKRELVHEETFELGQAAVIEVVFLDLPGSSETHVVAQNGVSLFEVTYGA